MTGPLLLREYESTDVELTAADARALAAAAGNALAVTVGPTPGTWRVTAGGYIGTVVTPGVQVLLRPKVPLHNVFLLLDAGIPTDAWSAESFGFGADPDLLPAIAAFFARAATQALARGPRHDYVRRDERLVGLRGRIDLPAQLRTPGMASPIACSYDDFSADILDNRALRAAARQLLRLPGVTPATRRDLTRLVLTLDEVADDPVTVEAIERIPVTRLNRHYQPSLRLAEIVLRNASLQDRAGAAPAGSFLLSTPLLFQRWITGRLRRALVGRLEVDAEPTVRLDVKGRIRMDPDLVFRQGTSTVYVGDIKYKLSSGAGRSSDYYQLLAYTTALRLDEGVLIYCQTDDAPPDQEAVVKATNARLVTYLLPMTGTNADVEVGVSRLGEWLAARAASGHTALA